MKATDANGLLTQIEGCTISIPGAGTLIPRILPEISDSKSASYTDEVVIGRSFPIKTFSHADNRVFSVRWHFLIINAQTRTEAVNGLKAIQSCVYPYDQSANGSTPYAPPAICKLSCKRLFATGKDEAICAVLRRYAVSYPTEVGWDEETYLPYKFSVEMEWEAVFASTNLPGRDKIIS
jgi:hypothetical protein